MRLRLQVARCRLSAPWPCPGWAGGEDPGGRGGHRPRSKRAILREVALAFLHTINTGLVRFLFFGIFGIVYLAKMPTGRKSWEFVIVQKVTRRGPSLEDADDLSHAHDFAPWPTVSVSGHGEAGNDRASANRTVKPGFHCRPLIAGAVGGDGRVRRGSFIARIEALCAVGSREDIVIVRGGAAQGLLLVFFHTDVDALFMQFLQTSPFDALPRRGISEGHGCGRAQQQKGDQSCPDCRIAAFERLPSQSTAGLPPQRIDD